MTDPKELDRVRRIHRILDEHAVPGVLRAAALCIPDIDGSRHYYDLQLVLDWPNIKSMMIQDLHRSAELPVVSWDGRMTRCGYGGDWRTRTLAMDPECVDAYKRGLCFYREMLGKVEEEGERTGPYGGADLGHERVVAALTSALPANEAARRRMVAALAADLNRPAPVRFPAEGRSERALPWSNGRER